MKQKPAPKPTRSGTSRTYAARLEAGRPNKTFALPLATVEQIDALKEKLGVSGSQVVVMSVALLAGQKKVT